MRPSQLALCALVALLCSGVCAQALPRFGPEFLSTGELSRPNLLPAGDLDGDSTADFLATTDDQSVLGIEARSGSTGAVLWTIPNIQLSSDGIPGKAAWLRIDDLDGDGASEIALVSTAGIEVRSGRTGQQRPGSFIAVSSPRWSLMANASDRNGDGFREVAIYSAGFFSDSFSIYDPAAGAVLRSSVLVGGRALVNMQPVDDLDGDLIPDFALGKTDPLPGGFHFGGIYLVSGLDGSAISSISNFTEARFFGSEFHAYRDLTGDGIREIAVAFGSTGSLPGRVVVIDPTSNVVLTERFASYTSSLRPQLQVLRPGTSEASLILSGFKSPTDPITGRAVIAEEIRFDPNPLVLELTFSIDASDFLDAGSTHSDFQVIGDATQTGIPDFLFSYVAASGRARPVHRFQAAAIVPYGSNPNPLGPFNFIIGNPATNLTMVIPSSLSPAGGWFLVGPAPFAQSTPFGELLVDPNSAVLINIPFYFSPTIRPDPSWQGSTLYGQAIYTDPAAPGTIVLGPAYRVLF